MTPPPIVEVENVTKVYPSRPPVVALRGITFSVAPGELVAIVGPSGSGKTTLLHIMGTLDRPTDGVVRIGGLAVGALSDADLSGLRATRIGFVFQQYFLAEHSTVLDNVADGLLYAGVGFRERRERALVALTLVGLGSRPNARPTQLSGGQRQRVAIARALVGQPAIVLADEPTGNLDSATGQSVLDLIQELNARGTTIVVITHDHGVASRMRRQVEMLDGGIIADSGWTASRRVQALA
jgi:putative ABC transport system ATP-binding protein